MMHDKTSKDSGRRATDRVATTPPPQKNPKLESWLILSFEGSQGRVR